jgi:hypothetical protein
MNREKRNPTTGMRTARLKMARVAVTPVAISFDNPL